jgi:hypothetical protein
LLCANPRTRRVDVRLAALLLLLSFVRRLL